MLYLDSVPKHHVEVIVRKYIINDLMTNYLQSKSNNRLGPFKITYTDPELQSLFIEQKVKLCMESPSAEETKFKGLGVGFYFPQYHPHDILPHLGILEKFGTTMDSFTYQHPDNTNFYVQQHSY
jgi:hypothetical protein